MVKDLVGSGDLKFERVAEIDKIKELTGGDNINVEAKFKNSGTMKYKGFLLYNCNSLPLFGGDNGEHVYNRFIILSCDNVVPKEKRDPELKEKLWSERDIVSSIAVKFLKKAIERGYKFTESERTENNRREYALKNNSLALFVDECCEIGEERTNVAEFKRLYNQWCDKNGVVPERPHKISQRMENEFKVIKGKSGTDYYKITVKIKEEQPKEEVIEQQKQ